MAFEIPPPTDRDAPSFVRGEPAPIRKPNGQHGETRSLPHNLDAEQSVLGGILLKPAVLAEVPELEVDCFYDPRHKQVFAAMRNIEARGEPIDLTTLQVELDRRGVFEAIGGHALLGELALRVPTVDNLIHYARIVVEDYISRVVMLRASEAIEEIRSRYRDGRTGGAELMRDVASFLERSSFREATYGTPVIEWLGDDEPSEDDSEDWYLRGLIARGVPQIIGGDPKAGKTMITIAWALCLALGLDWCGLKVYRRARVLIMPREDNERTTRIRLWQLARGLGLTSPHVAGPFLSVDAASPLVLGERAYVERMRRACDRYDVVLIDSLSTAHHGDENSARDMSEVMGNARDIALSTKTALDFIHHLNGKGDADDKRPIIHRLRGSSAIAGFARHIVGVSRGPVPDTRLIEVDGNFKQAIEPFAVKVVDLEVNGKRGLKYERVELQDVERAAAEIKSVGAEVFVRDLVAGAAGPISRTQIYELAGARKQYAGRAIQNLLFRGEIVEIEQRTARGKKKLWSRDKAVAAGLEIALPEGGSE